MKQDNFPKEITTQFEGQTISWSFLSKGAFNRVYISTDAFQYPANISPIQHWVLKIPIKPLSDSLDTVDDSLRMWRQINSDLPAHKYADGWICPYYGKTEASDEKTAEELRDIYIKTGRIVVDASGLRNFLFSNNTTICVDVAAALSPSSPRSQKYWRNHHSYFESFWNRTIQVLIRNSEGQVINIRYRMLTIMTIKALLLLNETSMSYKPEFINLLGENKTLCYELATNYVPLYPVNSTNRFNLLVSILKKFNLDILDLYVPFEPTPLMDTLPTIEDSPTSDAPLSNDDSDFTYSDYRLFNNIDTISSNTSSTVEGPSLKIT